MDDHSVFIGFGSVEISVCSVKTATCPVFIQLGSVKKAQGPVFTVRLVEIIFVS